MDKIQKINLAFLLLILLTVGGGLIGKHAQSGFWITVVIALTALIKGRLVIDYFMELAEASPLIRRMVGGFCAIIPVLMVVTYVWSDLLVLFSQSILR